MLLQYVLSAMFVLVCLMLLLVVLLQQGRGGDIASAFGGGSSQTAFGARAGATVLSKATAVLGALFMIAALALAIIGQRGPGSVVSGVKGAEQPPANTTPAAPSTAPATQPPAQQPSTTSPAGGAAPTPATSGQERP